MEWVNILVIILESLVPLICLVIGTLIINFLKKKGLKEEELAYIDTAYSLLTKAVMTTNQLWVDTIKENEGKLSPEQQEDAREDTIKIFNDMLTEGVKLAIEAAYGSVEKWLNINLEAAVGEVKLFKN